MKTIIVQLSILCAISAQGILTTPHDANPNQAPPCTAARTANCTPKTDASGNLSVGSTVQLSGTGDVIKAINTALSACPSGGCVIDATGYTPSGTSSATLALNKPVLLKLPVGTINSSASPMVAITSSGVRVEGIAGLVSADAATVLNQTSFSVVVSIGTAAALKSIGLKDIAVKGGTICIDVEPSTPNYVSQLLLEGVTATQCGSDGVKLAAVYDVTVHRLRAYNNGGVGLNIAGASNSTTESGFYDVYSGGNTGDQLNITSSQGLVFFRPSLFSNATSGKACLHINSSDTIEVYSPWLETCAIQQILLESVGNFRLFGGRIVQTGTAKGLVVSFNGSNNPNANWTIDANGWTNQSNQAKIDASAHSGATTNVWLGSTGDGPFVPSDVTGLSGQYPGPVEWQFQPYVSERKFRLAAAYTNTTTTLSNVFAWTARAGGEVYQFEATLFITADATGRCKVTVNNISGSIQQLIWDAEITDLTAGTITTTRNTSNGTTVTCPASGNTLFQVRVRGTVGMSADGTFAIQAAENSASGTLTIQRGSYGFARLTP